MDMVLTSTTRTIKMNLQQKYNETEENMGASDMAFANNSQFQAGAGSGRRRWVQESIQRAAVAALRPGQGRQAPRRAACSFSPPFGMDGVERVAFPRAPPPADAMRHNGSRHVRSRWGSATATASTDGEQLSASQTAAEGPRLPP